MDELELKLCVSCLPGLSGMQKLAVSLTGITVSKILRFTYGTFQDFLYEYHIIARRDRTPPHPFDRGSIERGMETLLKWVSRTDRGIVFLGDPLYPPYLAMGENPPYRLCCAGTIPGQEIRLLAVAGTRTPTGAAICECYRFGLDAALNGVFPISSLSVGCDQACARGVVDAGGGTWALLPCGTEYPYPSCPKLRETMIANGGGLLSPFLPDEPPLRWRFLYRNELLATVAPWIVLFQGGVRSGTLLIADSALRHGRDILVHQEGAIDLPASRGTHGLVRDGAGVIDGYRGLSQASKGLYPCLRSVRPVDGSHVSPEDLWKQNGSGSLYRYRNAWYSL